MLIIPRIGMPDVRIDYSFQRPSHWKLVGSTATIEFPPLYDLPRRIVRHGPHGRLWVHNVVDDHGVRIGDDNASLVFGEDIVRLSAPVVHLSSTSEGEFVLCQPPNERTLLYRFATGGRLLWQMGPRDFRPDDTLYSVGTCTAQGVVVKAVMNGWEGLVDLDTGRFERVLRTELR